MQKIVHSPLIIDVAGTELSAQDQRRLMHPLVGGVIHFARNWQDRQQLSQLNQAIKQLRPDILIAVDHEGGRVQRFREHGFTHLPAMSRLGELLQQDADLAQQTAVAFGYVLAAELCACGVDFSFTPVLDLDYGNSSVIGDRAIAASPASVSQVARCLNYGLKLAGMANCGKHFPGHGYVAGDSHLAIPIDERPLEQILQADVKPYQGLNPGLASIMPAHVVYSQVDSKPAGFSAYWLKHILRQQLLFQGAIFSDDLSMAGAREVAGQELSFAQAGCLALNSGCDLVLLCNQSIYPAVLDDFIDQMQTALNVQQWQLNPQSEQRRRTLLATGQFLTWEELQYQPQYQLCRQQLAQLD